MGIFSKLFGNKNVEETNAMHKETVLGIIVFTKFPLPKHDERMIVNNLVNQQKEFGRAISPNAALSFRSTSLAEDEQTYIQTTCMLEFGPIADTKDDINSLFGRIVVGNLAAPNGNNGTFTVLLDRPPA
jgi:hypothetical protein